MKNFKLGRKLPAASLIKNRTLFIFVLEYRIEYQRMRGRGGGEGDWHQELTVLFSPGILREKRTVSYHGNVIFQPGARSYKSAETRKWKKIGGIVTCICLCKPQDQNRLAEANTVSGPQQYGHDGGVLSLGSLCSKLTTKLQSLMTPATLQWPSEMVAESQLLRSWVLSEDMVQEPGTVLPVPPKWPQVWRLGFFQRHLGSF